MELPSLEIGPINTVVVLGDDFQNLLLEIQNEIIAKLNDAYMEEMRARNTSKYEVRGVTWAERTERLGTIIVGVLVNPEIGWERMLKEQAIII